MEKSDSVNGVLKDWRFIEELDLEKGSNTTEEALDALLVFFFVVTNTKDDMVRLQDMVNQDVFQYLNATVHDLRDSILRVYGEEFIIKDVGKNKQMYGLVKWRFKPIPETVNSEEGTYQSGARIRFERSWKNVCIYQHSGILLVEDKDDGQPFVLELNNQANICLLEVNRMEDVVNRSEFSSMFFNFDTDVETNETRVLMENNMDFMMIVIAATHGLSWNYHWSSFNCHHVSYFLLTGVIGSPRKDKTLLQMLSEVTGVLAPTEENKPIANIGIKELIVMLYNKKLEKRARMSKISGAGLLV